MIGTDRKMAYRETPGCSRGCVLCEVRCAVAIGIRDDIAVELARAEAAVLAFCPQGQSTRH